MGKACTDRTQPLRRGGALLAAVLLAGCGPTGEGSATVAGAGNGDGGNEMQALEGIPVAPGKLSPEQQAELFAPPAPRGAP